MVWIKKYIMKLVFATNNKNKLRELQALLGDRFELLSLDDIGCFEEIPEGEYNISVAAPEGYNPTTLMNYSLALQAGESSTLDFGAQISSLAVPTPVSEGGRSPVLGIMGGILVLAGAGMGIYVWRLRSS